MKATTTVIGLGAMGIALARALLRDGHRVTVWNRTAAKAEPLVRDGAVLAPSAASAIAASTTVVVCVDDYEVTHKILGTKEAASALAGRVLIQLTTGTPQEARDGEAWAREQGADYLDGKIFAWPRQIGTPEAAIFVAGRESVFQKSEPILKTLAGNVTHLGEQIGLAAALHLAGTSYLVGSWLGFVHGAQLCQAEGLRADFYGSLLADSAPAFAAEARHLGEVVHRGKYQNPESSLATDANAVEAILQQARDARINAEFPTFALELFRRGVAAGYGEEEPAALIKVLRNSSPEIAQVGGAA